MDYQGNMSENENERGIAMVSVLMFLVILTLIGMSALESSGLQERMSGNMRDQDVAFQAAENAVREGETWVASLTALPPFSPSGSGDCVAPCANVVWDINAVEVNGGNFLDHAFWNAGTNTRPATAVSGAQTPPMFVVERNWFLSDPGGSLDEGQPTDQSEGFQVFRITARGTGQTNDSRSVIQTTFAQRFN